MLIQSFRETRLIDTSCSTFLRDNVNLRRNRLLRDYFFDASTLSISLLFLLCSSYLHGIRGERGVWTNLRHGLTRCSPSAAQYSQRARIHNSRYSCKEINSAERPHAVPIPTARIPRWTGFGKRSRVSMGHGYLLTRHFVDIHSLAHRVSFHPRISSCFSHLKGRGRVCATHVCATHRCTLKHVGCLSLTAL